MVGFNAYGSRRDEIMLLGQGFCEVLCLSALGVELEEKEAQGPLLGLSSVYSGHRLESQVVGDQPQALGGHFCSWLSHFRP